MSTLRLTRRRLWMFSSRQLQRLSSTAASLLRSLSTSLGSTLSRQLLRVRLSSCSCLRQLRFRTCGTTSQGTSSNLVNKSTTRVWRDSMPKATANIVEPERHELKTLPEGFVVLRRLTYGQKLERKAMASVASAEQGRGKQSMKMQIAMISEQAQLYDF